MSREGIVGLTGIATVSLGPHWNHLSNSGTTHDHTQYWFRIAIGWKIEFTAVDIKTVATALDSTNHYGNYTMWIIIVLEYCQYNC